MKLYSSLLVSALTVLLIISACSTASQEAKAEIPSEPPLAAELAASSKATFAGGCFWCVEAVFERVEGVVDVVSGYTGGQKKNPTYYEVGSGKTNHAEAVQIFYNPNVITYQELLEIFFATHDPTQVNRQGPDVGKQYRTEVFYHDEEQKVTAETYIAKLNKSGKFNKPIATQVTAYDIFYLAEDYHQNYYEINPNNPYVRSVSVPKVKKLFKLFPDKIKTKYRKEIN